MRDLHSVSSGIPKTPPWKLGERGRERQREERKTGDRREGLRSSKLALTSSCAPHSTFTSFEKHSSPLALLCIARCRLCETRITDPSSVRQREPRNTKGEKADLEKKVLPTAVIVHLIVVLTRAKECKEVD